MPALRLSDVALLRVLAQRLAGPAHPDVATTVARLGALQAQDLPGALVSVALRTAGHDCAAVVAALDAGTVVRTWPMRGTLHLVPAADAAWMARRCAARPLRAAAARWRQLGIDAAAVHAAGDVAAGVLAAGPARRAALVAAWGAAGLPVEGQAAVHLLNALAMQSVLCLGPLAGREQLVVLHDAWVPAPRVLDGDAALVELAGRYARSHGPTTARDLAWWTGLPVTEARRALAAVEGLARVDVDGVEHVLDPAVLDALPAARRAARAPLLLPGFDELLLGYGDRRAVLPPEHADRVVPGGNGMFRATVVHGGRVVAVWRRAGTAARRSADVEPFAPLPAAVAAAVPRLLARPPWLGT